MANVPLQQSGGGSSGAAGVSSWTGDSVIHNNAGSVGAVTATLISQTQNTFLCAPNGSGGTPTFRAIVAADVPTLNQNTSGSAGSVAWSGITNAAGALTLANAGNATTFNQTSAVNWTWANTTAATSGTSQSSPIFNVNGTYWTGAASATDSWTIQDVVANGTNGTSYLTFGHSGSTGLAGLSAPTLLLTNTITTNTAVGLCKGGASNGNIAICTSNTSSAIFALYNAGTLQYNFGQGGITAWNAETTAAVGVAYIRGSTSQKAETGADASVLSVTPAAAVGSYRIRIAISCSAATAATLGWTATWTDSNGSAQAPTNLALFQTGVAAPALTFTAAAAACYYADLNVDINNAGTAIVVKTTFSGTSIAYKVSATIERLI